MIDDFYVQTLRALMTQGWITRESRVLVVCGGQADKETYQELGFSNVIISNLDERHEADQFAPYEWSYQDAENIQYPDESFDYCIVHNGLHHCFSPHRALLEMYRVSRKGVLVFEPRETLLVRLGVALNLGQQYEVAAVAGNGLKYGGVRNTAIPNYVFRWTEREIEQTICTSVPYARPRFQYFYSLRVPEPRLRALKNKFYLFVVKLGLPLLKVFTFLFPKQCNAFGFAINKPKLPEDLQPWLQMVDGKPAIRSEWFKERYGAFLGPGY